HRFFLFPILNPQYSILHTQFSILNSQYSIPNFSKFGYLSFAMDYEDLITLGIAFGLGLLVGLQREKSDHEMAGVRTFTLIAILGVVAGFLTRDFKNPFILPIFGIAITALMLMANFMKSKKEPNIDVGQTTEVAVLLM